MLINIWIEKNWAEAIEEANFDDLQNAIEELIKEEHGALWIGNHSNLFTLELHKNLTLLFGYGDQPDQEFKTKLSDWKDAKHFFQLYFDGEFEKLKNELECSRTPPKVDK